MNRELASKCTGTRDDGGYGGTIVLERPDFCTVRPPGFEKPEVVITDSVVKRIIEEVTDGKLTAESIQEYLDKEGIKDIVIEVVGQASADGDKGRITIKIKILGTRDEKDYVIILNRVIAKRCGVSEDQVKTTIFKETTVSAKRSIETTAGDNYIQESTIYPSGSFLLTPIWSLLLLSFLFMRLN
jgi:hypothetical protein